VLRYQREPIEGVALARARKLETVAATLHNRAARATLRAVESVATVHIYEVYKDNQAYCLIVFLAAKVNTPCTVNRKSYEAAAGPADVQAKATQACSRTGSRRRSRNRSERPIDKACAGAVTASSNGAKATPRRYIARHEIVKSSKHTVARQRGSSA
jgi:hypothetical protein